MRTKYTAHYRQKQRIRQFVKIDIEPARKQHQETDQSYFPVALNKPATIVEPEKKQLLLFMEPIFKAKEFDPL